MISIDMILTILNKTIDILLVWMIFYYILKLIKDNVKLTLIFKGVLFIIILKIVSNIFHFTTIGMILEYVIMWGPLALIIVFQPEHNFCTGDGKTAGHAGVVKSVTYDDNGNVESIVINHTHSSSGNQTVTLYPNNDHGSTLNYSTNNTQFITPK